MPVPGPALLLLWHSDINPAGAFCLNDANEFAQVCAGPVKVGDVIAISKSQEMIGTG